MTVCRRHNGHTKIILISMTLLTNIQRNIWTHQISILIQNLEGLLRSENVPKLMNEVYDTKLRPLITPPLPYAMVPSTIDKRHTNFIRKKNLQSTINLVSRWRNRRDRYGSRNLNCIYPVCGWWTEFVSSLLVWSIRFKERSISAPFLGPMGERKGVGNWNESTFKRSWREEGYPKRMDRKLATN